MTPEETPLPTVAAWADEDDGASDELIDDLIAEEQARKTEEKKPKSFFSLEPENLEEEAVDDLIHKENDRLSGYTRDQQDSPETPWDDWPDLNASVDKKATPKYWNFSEMDEELEESGKQILDHDSSDKSVTSDMAQTLLQFDSSTSSADLLPDEHNLFLAQAQERLPTKLLNEDESDVPRVNFGSGDTPVISAAASAHKRV